MLLSLLRVGSGHQLPILHHSLARRRGHALWPNEIHLYRLEPLLQFGVEVRGEVGRGERERRGAVGGGLQHGGGGGGQRGRGVAPQRPHLPQGRPQRAGRPRTRLLHHVRVVRHDSGCIFIADHTLERRMAQQQVGDELQQSHRVLGRRHQR